jgi:signal transduction histidine kinase
MSFRRKILIVVVLAVLCSVGSVAWIVSVRTRRAFAAADGERVTALVAQLRREFDRRGEEVAQRITGIAASEEVMRMALDLAHGTEPAVFVSEARPIAEAHQLDFLEFVSSEGEIISSAQWPARFGYKEAPPKGEPAGAFLKQEELADGPALGMFAVRTVRGEDKPLHVLGGQRIDREFLSGLVLPAGMRVLLYRNFEKEFSPAGLVSLTPIENPWPFKTFVQRVQQSGAESWGVLYWSVDSADSEMFQAIPLKADDGSLLGVLLVGSSRRSLVELQRHIRAVAWTVAGSGILFAIAVSVWIAARMTRPIDRLADAAREVTAGNWNTEVQLDSRDELGQLAEAFNRMTRELLQQRERLVQSERVAAWRELARRLAHELKNPLFPLQIAVENLVRAHDSMPQEFEEVFREGSATLLAEIANLKAIIGRFSDFSKMPQPQLQPAHLNDIVRQVVALHSARAGAASGAASPGVPSAQPSVDFQLELDPALPMIDADPDLMHRVLSNLVLNAMDAMPEGGTITIRTHDLEQAVALEVSDTGSGLTPEECRRLFTPYYTTKQHGTGLGLAIVQSVVSDHKGSISVESVPGQGATFRIELPKKIE